MKVQGRLMQERFNENPPGFRNKKKKSDIFLIEQYTSTVFFGTDPLVLTQCDGVENACQPSFRL